MLNRIKTAFSSARLGPLDACAGGIAVLCILASVRHFSALPPARADGVAHLLALYEGAVPYLPANQPVAFLQRTPGSVDSIELRFVVQYAIVPRLLTDDPTAASVAVSPPAFSREEKLATQESGWRLIATLDGGVCVYAR
ncbi:MAG: hypothetical protein IT180_15700 [Acidobacteria bacterium]|nr:hypothetical protein [Acidobacteriota bacterium]